MREGADAMATSDVSDPLLQRFLDMLWLEEGLSLNTRKAYQSDLHAFSLWLEKDRGLPLEKADAGAIEGYLAFRYRKEAKSRSMARLISSLRKFFRYLLREGLAEDDPTLRIDPPKIGRPLPKTLSEEDVEALLAAPDVLDPLGLRDRAMLELLYATGLRVTELVSLRVVQVNLRQGVVRVVGKGSKDRLVPVGEESEVWLARYAKEARPVIFL
jgi:integrase/recombinase XerD